MSKIVVDKIQSSGGVEISIPSTDGVANSAVVTDGNGALGFAEFSLPSDGGQVGQFLKSDGNGGTEWGSVQSDSVVYSVDKSGIIPSKLNIVLPPVMSGSVGSVTVNDGTTYYCGGADGASCNWTVPAGVTEASFQLWGSGSNGMATGNCCTWGSHGADGSYKYVHMTVSEGDLYCMCSGGACATGGSAGSYSCGGCNTFICGSAGTCIMSCGAPVYDYFYSDFMLGSGCNGCGAGQNIYYDCYAGPSGQESFSCTIAGPTASTNTIFKEASVRPRKGTWNMCAYDCHYTRAISATHINADHSYGRCYFGAFCACGTQGCCNYTGDRGPGRGGMGTHARNYCSPSYGSYGNTGEIIVKYK